MARTKIFVSYSHLDRTWLDRFVSHAAVLQRQDLVEIWSDIQVLVGAEWEAEIERALSAASVAVLLVSPDFLASEYIWKQEMPRVFTHSKQGMAVSPLIVRPCAWQLEEGLARFQARPVYGGALSLGKKSRRDLELSTFVYELAARIGRSPAAMAPIDAGTTRRVPGDEPANPAGEWTGFYNRTRAMRLLIGEVKGNVFRGRMDYPDEDTATRVEGFIHEQWSAHDQIWAQVGGTSIDGNAFAVSFRETGYEDVGSSSISFDGEYRAFVKGDELAGAWFSGDRLVGTLHLRRTTDGSSRLRGKRVDPSRQLE